METVISPVVGGVEGILIFLQREIMLAHKTAIKRNKISAPMQKLLKDGRITRPSLDYGCGRGDDAYFLNMSRFDPYYFPSKPVGPFETITCNYVLNVIESQQERMEVLGAISALLSKNGKAYITVRNDIKNLKGYTKIGTWQGKIELDLPVLYKNSGFVTYIMEK